MVHIKHVLNILNTEPFLVLSQTILKQGYCLQMPTFLYNLYDIENTV